MDKKVIRLKTTKTLTGLSRSTIYAMMKNGTFPHNFSLGPRAVGWLESDVEAWIDSRISSTKNI